MSKIFVDAVSKATNRKNGLSPYGNELSFNGNRVAALAK